MAENGAGSVILYLSRYSPYAWRPQLSLVEKGIPYTPVTVDLTNKPKELLEANPIYGKIPAMVHNGNSICESVVILEYIEEAWPNKKPLMPKDALGKSKARFWTDYIYKGFAHVIQIARGRPGSPEREAAMAEVAKFLKTLDATMVEYSADGPFFTGDEFGYLDVILAPFSCWMKVMETLLEIPIPGPEELPRLHKWVTTLKARKTVKDTLPTEDEVMEFFGSRLKAHQEILKAQAAEKK